MNIIIDLSLTLVRVQALPKTPIIITKAVCIMKLISYLHPTHIYTWFVVSDESSSKNRTNNGRFIDISSGRLWLANAFQSSTESSVIG